MGLHIVEGTDLPAKDCPSNPTPVPILSITCLDNPLFHLTNHVRTAFAGYSSSYCCKTREANKENDRPKVYSLKLVKCAKGVFTINFILISTNCSLRFHVISLRL